MNSSTVSFPRSVSDKYLGVVQLARTIDKAKMVANGTIGEYHFGCPMDEHLFAEFDIDGKKLAAIVSEAAKNGAHTGNLEAYLKPLLEKKTRGEIDRFNDDTLTQKPSPESSTAFNALRTKVAPERTDVTTWPDLLDLEEGRTVPKRTGGV